MTRLGLPAEWEKICLRVATERIMDGTHFSPKSKSGPYRYLTSKNIKDGQIDLNNFEHISEDEHREIYSKCPVIKGDVLLTKDGAKVGNVAINNIEEEFSLLSSVAVLRAKNGVLLNSYLYQLLQSPLGQNLMLREVAGQAITRITLTIINQIKIPLPPVKEQIAIARSLSNWDRAIDLTERLIVEKRLRRKGLMQQLLTGKRRLPGFTGRRREVRLGNIFHNRIEVARIDLPLVSIAGDRGVIPRDEIDRKDSSSEDKSKYLRICPGDIGYNTMRMWQGVSGLSTLEGIVSPAYTILTPMKGIDAEYMSILFKFQPVIHLFYRHSQGMVSDTWNLKFRHFAKIKVTIPDENEQKAIAKVFRGIDRELELLQAKAVTLRQQKKGLMQQLLTGKMRVKV